MKINKALIIAGIVTVTVTVTGTAAAGWFGGGGWTFTGGPVIDYSRLQDSIRQTAEWVKMAVNQAEMLTNQIMVNTGLAGLGKDFTSIKNSISDLNNSTTSIINTARGFDNLQSSKAYTEEQAIKKYRELTGNIQQDAETLIHEGLLVNSAVGNRNQKTDDEIKTITSDVSPGVLAEKQKANALAILKAQKLIEKAKMTYAVGVADLEVTNLQGKKETLAEAANVQFLVKPLTGNQLKNSAKSNIGLLRIK